MITKSIASNKMMQEAIKKAVTPSIENKKRQDQEVKAKVGKYDQHGQKIESASQALSYSGDVYATQDEALDRRYSKGEGKFDKRRPSIFGNARANIFGN